MTTRPTEGELPARRSRSHQTLNAGATILFGHTCCEQPCLSTSLIRTDLFAHRRSMVRVLSSAKKPVYFVEDRTLRSHRARHVRPAMCQFQLAARADDRKMTKKCPPRRHLYYHPFTRCQIATTSCSPSTTKYRSWAAAVMQVWLGAMRSLAPIGRSTGWSGTSSTTPCSW